MLRVGERQPNIVVTAWSDSGESLFSYADNRKWDIVQFDRMADNVAGASEGALPVTIIQHGDRRGGRFVVVGFEQPADCGLKTHRTEEVLRNELAIDDGRRAVPCQVQPTRVGKGSRRLKNICLCYFAKQRFRKRAARRIRSTSPQVRGAISRIHVAVNVGRVTRVPSEHYH